MRILVCGGRGFGLVLPADRLSENRVAQAKIERDLFEATMAGFDNVTCIIHGKATGADALADQWAKKRSIAIESYPADWVTYGKAAGPLRNKQMLTQGKPDLVLAFPGGAGTANMINLARANFIEVQVVT